VTPEANITGADPLAEFLDKPISVSRIRGSEKLNGVQPELLDHWGNLQNQFKQVGLTPEIKSGFRTAEQQNSLYRSGAPTKGNDGYINISPHQEGRALDISFSGSQKARGRQILANYARENGLHIPSDEPWHIALPKQSQSQDPLAEFLDKPQTSATSTKAQSADPLAEFLDQPKPSVIPMATQQKPITEALQELTANVNKLTAPVVRKSLKSQVREQLSPPPGEKVDASQLVPGTPGYVAPPPRPQEPEPDYLAIARKQIQDEAAQRANTQEGAGFQMVPEVVEAEAQKRVPQVKAEIARQRQFAQSKTAQYAKAGTEMLGQRIRQMSGLPEEESRNIAEGVAGSLASTAKQVGNLADLPFRPFGGGTMAGDVGGKLEAGVGQAQQGRTAPVGTLGEIRRGVERGVGSAAVELPKLLGGAKLLSALDLPVAANLPIQGALSRADEGVPGIVKGAGNGLVYHYGGGVTGQYLGKVGNSLIWIGAPAAEAHLVNGTPWTEAISQNLPMGLFAGMSGSKVQVKDGETVRDATPKDLPKIADKSLSVIPPEETPPVVANPHHANLQPRTTEGQFDGPPIAPTKAESEVIPEVPPASTETRASATESLPQGAAQVAPQPQNEADLSKVQSGESSEPVETRKAEQPLLPQAFESFARSLPLSREEIPQFKMPLVDRIEDLPRVREQARRHELTVIKDLFKTDDAGAEKIFESYNGRGTSKAVIEAESKLTPQEKERVRHYEEQGTGYQFSTKYPAQDVAALDTAEDAASAVVTSAWDLTGTQAQEPGDAYLFTVGSLVRAKELGLTKRQLESEASRIVGPFPDVVQKVLDRVRAIATFNDIDLFSEGSKRISASANLTSKNTPVVEPKSSEGVTKNVVSDSSLKPDLSSSKQATGAGETPAPEYPNVPERPETITAQLEQRGYALIPKNTPRPPKPTGYGAELTPDGVVYYDPKRIDAETIRDTPTNELLGHVEPKGPTTTQAVVARDASGNEVHASAVSPENVDAQVAKTQEQFPNAKVERGGADLAQKVIANRTEEPAPFNWHTREDNGEWKIINPDGKEVSRVADRKVAEQIVDEMRNRPGEVTGMSLSQAARAKGGLNPGPEGRGEWAEVSDRPLGSSGVVNRKSGHSEEDMARMLAEDGYGIGDWAHQQENQQGGIGKGVFDIDLNRFRQAMADDTLGRQKSYTQEDMNNADAESQYRKYQQTQQDEHDNDATVTLLENEGTGALYDKIVSGQANAEDIIQFKRHATELGISPEATDKLVASAREGGIQETPDVQPEDRSAAVPESKPGTGDQGSRGDVERVTSVKNAVTTAERAERGLGPVEKELARGDQEVWAKAKRDVDNGVVNPDKLAAEVAKKPRPLDEDETAALLYRRTQLHNQREAQMSAAEEAIKSGDKVKAAEHNLQIQETERLLGVNEEADVRAGTKQGRAFRIRQLMAKQDFSLAAMERRARVARGGDLSAVDKATIKEQHDQIAKLTTELERIKQQQEFSLTQDAVKKIIRDEKFSARKERRTTTRKALDDEFETLKKQLASVWKKPSGSGVHPMGLAALDPEGIATKIVLRLAKNRVQAGHVTAEGLVDAVHEKIADTVDLTKREVAEMISGYGKTSKPNPDPIETKLRELKSIIASNLGKADVIEKGIRPLRRGYQPDKPSVEVRAAMKDLRDTLREHGIKVEKSDRSAEDEQKSILDAAKTRARNRIEDLNKWIKDGKRTVANKTEVIPDNELKGLHAERDALQKVFEAIKDPEADQKTIENALHMVNRSVADLEARIKSGDISLTQRQTVSPWSEELGKQQQRRVELQKQLTEMRKAAESKPDPETVRLESAMKATEKSIADMQEKLRSGELTNKGTSSAPWSPEFGKLKREQAGLQKQLNDARKAARPAVDVEQRRIEQSLKATEKSITNLETRIKGNQTAVTPREGAQSAYSPDIVAAKKAQAALRNVLADMRNAEKGRGPLADPDVAEARKLLSAHKALNERLAKQVTEYQRRIEEIKKTGKPYEAPPKKEPFARTQAERAFEERIGRLKQQYEAANRKASLTPADWVARLVVGTGRFAKLTYGGTIGKLTSAATGRIVTSPIEDIWGGVVGRALPGLYEGAPGEGKGSTPPAAKVAADKFGGSDTPGLRADHVAGIERLWKSDTWRQVVNKLITGHAQQDILYGKGERETDFLGLPGRVHGTFKEPVRQVTFYRQFRRRLGQIDREGKLDINDPRVQMAAAGEAWNDAARSIFMQRNFISDGFNNMVSGWERSGKAGPKTAAFLARLEFPITRVPVNVASEGLNYTFGLARALPETAYRLGMQKGFSEMTPEQKDSLMRAYKKGGIGLAMMAWGFAQPQHFGGYFQKGEKRKENEPGFGEQMWFGHRIPKWAGHVPILEPAQIGATFRRLAALEAAGGTAKGFVSQIPFYETPGRFFAGMEGPRQASRFLGEQARGFVPGGIQEYAKYRDKNPQTGEANIRTPQGTFAERMKGTFKLGIPGARETVPINEKIERKQRIDTATEKRRSGEMSSEELDQQGLGRSTEKRIERNAAMSEFQQRFHGWQPDLALEKYERMDERQRFQVKELMEKKAWALTHSDVYSQAQKDANAERLQKLGIEARSPVRGSMSLKPPRLSAPRL
jgi:hypothetical protein